MKELIEDISHDRFKRVDDVHPIDWRYNDIVPPTKLVLKTAKKPDNFMDTNGVHIAIIPQTSGEYAVVFVLNDPLCADIFKVFCEDVIESSREIKPEDAVDFAFERYAKWMYLFKPKNVEKLSDKEIRGLLGELFVLKTKLIPKFGPSSALNSWMNRLNGKQDFIECDQWYEVKTMLEGNDTIHISSLEQLSRTDRGELVVVSVKKTSIESSTHKTLNSLYLEILDKLPSFLLKKQFSKIMLGTGFVPQDPYYDSFCYEVIGAIGYEVIDGFPRIVPDNVPYPGIPRVKYEISLEAIRQFEVEKWN